MSKQDIPLTLGEILLSGLVLRKDGRPLRDKCMYLAGVRFRVTFGLMLEVFTNDIDSITDGKLETSNR